MKSRADKENLQLRKAITDDSEFAYQTRKAAFRGYVEKASVWNEDEQRQLHQRRFAAQYFRVIQLSSIDVGIIAISRQPDCIKLHQMFILPKHQGRGIGEAAMTHIIKETRTLKLPIRLQVLKVNNRAFAFYQRLGFMRTSVNDAHILMERQP